MTTTPANNAFPQDRQARPQRHRGLLFGTIIVTTLVFGGLLLAGLLPRLAAQPKLKQDAKDTANAIPLVSVLTPKQAPTTVPLNLPGNITGSEQAVINARASGYVRRWYVDIGDRVRAGQILADIEAPDADQQVAQARAEVAGSTSTIQQTRANVTQQRANAEQARANVSRAQASLQQAKADLARARTATTQGLATIRQQQAQLRLAQTNQELARKTAERYQYLAKEGAIAQQTADQQTAAYETSTATVASAAAQVQATQTNQQALQESVLSAQANVRAFADGVRAARAAFGAAEANVRATQATVGTATATRQANTANLRRTQVLSGFQRITAPFDGVITARNIDVGSLVSAGGSGGSASGSSGNGAISSGGTNGGGSGGGGGTGGLFTLVRTDRVRVFVSVPQPFIGSVPVGQRAQVSVPEAGSRPFTGIITRNATVLDPNSRTLSTQIEIPNPQGVLRPGLFATVSFTVRQAQAAIRIPDTALITDARGTLVAVVNPDKTLHFQPVTVGTDYGDEMDITNGLRGNEQVVTNPTASLLEGVTVQTEAYKEYKRVGSGNKVGSKGGQNVKGSAPETQQGGNTQGSSSQSGSTPDSGASGGNSAGNASGGASSAGR